MKHTHTFSRRNFIGGTVAATAMGTLFETSVVQAQQAVPVIPPKQYERKIKVGIVGGGHRGNLISCLLYTSPSPRDGLLSRMPSSA